MIPDPLHPAVVHIPIAISIILPIVMLVSLLMIKRGASISSSWMFIGILALFLFGGALVAMNTGENDEESVEQIVEERYIEAHEEKAEAFTYTAGVLFALVLIGFFNSKYGSAARIAATILSLVMVVLAFQTGRAGGDLVYKHQANTVERGAYVLPGTNGGSRSLVEEEHDE